LISSQRALLLGVVAVLACNRLHRKDRDVTKADNEASRAATTLPGLAREVGLKFPGSARLIGVGRESGIDDMVRFKVELDRTTSPRSLRRLPCHRKRSNLGPGVAGPDQAFWDPSRAVRLRTGQAF